MYACVCIYIHTHTYKHTLVHTHTNAHTHTHTHTHTHAHTHRTGGVPWLPTRHRCVGRNVPRTLRVRVQQVLLHYHQLRQKFSKVLSTTQIPKRTCYNFPKSKGTRCNKITFSKVLSNFYGKYTVGCLLLNIYVSVSVSVSE